MELLLADTARASERGEKEIRQIDEDKKRMEGKGGNVGKRGEEENIFVCATIYRTEKVEMKNKERSQRSVVCRL